MAEGYQVIEPGPVDHSVQLSSWVGIPIDATMECRINPHHDFEFSIGTWQVGVELVFERHALQRFVELANRALTQPEHADPKAERVFSSPLP
ncbi:hypothetical protein GCM10027436_59230 [Actinophytocola sediminis]